MSEKKCECTLHQHLVGDGCEVCNPMKKPNNNLPEPWHSLAIAAGGISILAARFGKSRWTVRRWATKKTKMDQPASEIFNSLLKTMEQK